MKAYRVNVSGQFVPIEDILETIREGATAYYLIKEYGWKEQAPNFSRTTSLATIRTFAANHTHLPLQRTSDHFPYDFLVELDFGGNTVRIWCEGLFELLEAHKKITYAGAEWKEWH